MFHAQGAAQMPCGMNVMFVWRGSSKETICVPWLRDDPWDKLSSSVKSEQKSIETHEEIGTRRW